MNISNHFILLLAVAIVSTGFWSCNPPEKNKQEEVPSPNNTAFKEIVLIRDEATFNAFIEKPTVITFTAPWCTVCKQVQPMYEHVAIELGSHYQFAKLNIEEIPHIAKKYSIRGLPIVLCFNKGELISDHIFIGALNKDQLKNKISTIFSSIHNKGIEKFHEASTH